MILRKSDWHPADIIAALRKRGTTFSSKYLRQAGFKLLHTGECLISSLA
ncbi:DNA-binding transcriptional regulator Nlp [Providencia stuartii]|nr:DNA-binding transcriptional regulator Nlp [Providencia stuartii]